jgi:hypothetical protein
MLALPSISLTTLNPERFPNGAPVVALPPARVAITPLAAPVFLPQLGSNQ